jgi:cytidylate kinase
VRSYVLSGLSGSGKTTARDHAERLGYLAVSVGDVVRRRYEATDPDVPVGEFVLRIHERESRAAFARDAVAALERRVTDRERPPTGVVAEGVHSPAAVGVVRRRFGPTPVVWIRASPSRRLDRCRHRDGNRSAAELLRRDLRELNSGLAALAAPTGHAHRVDNDGSRAQFRRRLELILA